MLHLKKRLNRLETQDEQAQDYLFELEVAERLVRQGHGISFEEPDMKDDSTGRARERSS